MDAMTLTAGEAVKISLQDDDEFLGDEDFQYDAAVISSEEIGQSFVTCSLSLSRFGHYATASAALLVLRFELGGPPGNRHRFKSASILARLRPLTTTLDAAASSSSSSSLSVLKYWPERWSDVPSAKAVERRLGAGLSSGSIGALAVQSAAQRSVSYTRHAQRRVRGVASGRPVLSQVQWTLEENELEQDGIWEHFRLALLVRHDGKFTIDVAIKTKVGFSADPRKYLLRPLKGSSGARIVDPTLPIGEADAALDGNPDLRGVDLAGFTGFT
ncbi:hypothetical protein ISF_01395 [Cordyceps fumosorosea ARSEF 2679]|uniref:Uncharacterized protein n=1 Tax=Cordyceps fumosorosea (strain ARSEF 2679) TaxID=1081104 RepID=A0A162JQK2_CORFA|nr:hypothetical protein ISF_01395 [Cordyceps fumosorosea ARSEF 2679]OAA72322.1 hypothetical protein ISF_01395 [Cordyceps fumosorosea ARSEF 2679]